MKIVQTSQIFLGRGFSDSLFPGDKLRAGIKSVFSRIIDIALNESADLVILAGDTFDSVDVSQNLLTFFVSEIGRLEKIPVAVIAGLRDGYDKKSFWEHWRISPPAENLHILVDDERPHVEFPDLAAVVYGFPPVKDGPKARRLKGFRPLQGYDLHLGILYGHLGSDTDTGQNKLPLNYEELKSTPFDYIALGGHIGARSLAELGLKAAYAGSPSVLHPEWTEAGNILIVNLQKGSLNIQRRKLEGFVWKDAEIDMATVANMDDLKNRILEMAGQDILLRVSLTGLALLEAGLNLDQIKSDLDEHFLNLRIADRTRVLPDNVSAVKVQEKTILGQYLKIMVDRLNNASGAPREKMEESLKIGYTLLSGRRIW